MELGPAAKLEQNAQSSQRMELGLAQRQAVWFRRRIVGRCPQTAVLQEIVFEIPLSRGALPPEEVVMVTVSLVPRDSFVVSP